MDAVIDAVIKGLKEKLEDFEIKVTSNDGSEMDQKVKMIKAIDLKLESLEEKQNRLYDFLENGIYTKDVFMNRNELIEKEKKTLINEKKNVEQIISSVKPTKEKIASLHKAIDMLCDPSLPAENVNIFLKSFIKVMYYEKGCTSEDIQLEILLK